MSAHGPMHGRVCVVTGATGGIGKATAMGLARRGAHVVLLARDPVRASAVRAGIAAEAGHDRVDVVIADLAEQAQVRAAADEIAARHPAVHVLVNNAGTYTRRRTETPDGIETQLAVNHLAPFLLTHLLLPRLRAGAPARVVAVSSGAHRWARVRWDDLQMRTGYGGLRQYANTKLFNLLFTRELARRHPASGIAANAMHPGVVGTRILFDGWAPLRLLKPFMRTPEQGARTLLHLAASDEVQGMTGGYWRDEALAPTSPAARDDDAARRLWEMSAELVGLGTAVGQCVSA